MQCGCADPAARSRAPAWCAKRSAKGACSVEPERTAAGCALRCDCHERQHDYDELEERQPPEVAERAIDAHCRRESRKKGGAAALRRGANGAGAAAAAAGTTQGTANGALLIQFGSPLAALPPGTWPWTGKLRVLRPTLFCS